MFVSEGQNGLNRGNQLHLAVPPIPLSDLLFPYFAVMQNASMNQPFNRLPDGMESIWGRIKSVAGNRPSVDNY